MPELQLRDGASLAYRDTGSGRALVLLHGWSMRKDVFQAQFDAFDSRFRVVAPDFRGHGDSSPATMAHGMATLANDVSELIRALDLDRLLLVGWSMGATVAWKLLQTDVAPRIAGLVVIDMVPRILSEPDWPYGLREGTNSSCYDKPIESMRDNWPAFTRDYIPGNIAGGRANERADLVDRLFGFVQHNDPESMAVLWRALADEDLRDFVKSLTLPTLITYGERGQLYSRDAFTWMGEHIPNSQRVGFTDSGHAPHMEESEQFNAELERFAGELWTSERLQQTSDQINKELGRSS